MENDFAAVVIDGGSGLLKAGFAGENEPRLVMVPEVGRPRHREVFSIRNKQVLVGEEVRANRDPLDIHMPVQYGMVVNWPDMERVWDHVFTQVLQIDPSNNRILLAETPLNPKANRIKTIETMFEFFRVAGTFLVSQPVLAMYAAGRTTGLSLDCGYNVAHWVPVVEGYPLPQGTVRMGFGGRDLDEYLAQLLAEKGLFFTVERDGEILRDIKETFCYLAPDNEEEEFLRKAGGGQCDTYSLPDGSIIQLTTEKFRCPEALFRPSSMSLKSVGIGEAARLSLEQCHNKTLQRQMLECVVISGGSTHLKGFKERLQAEVTSVASLIDESAQVKVVAPPNRKYAAWVGGAIITALSTFEPLWIRREEYEEYGPSVVLRKCF